MIGACLYFLDVLNLLSKYGNPVEDLTPASAEVGSKTGLSLSPNRCASAPEDSGIFPKLPETSGNFRNILDYSGIIRNIPESSGKFRKV